jgi:hypothetical protein
MVVVKDIHSAVSTAISEDPIALPVSLILSTAALAQGSQSVLIPDHQVSLRVMVISELT